MTDHYSLARQLFLPEETIYKDILAIVNTIVPFAFPGIRLDQSEVMNELREITLLFLNFSIISFSSKSYQKRLRFPSPFPVPRSPFPVPCFEDRQPKQPPFIAR